MITTMPRPRPPHLSHERTCHGKSVWYVRRAGKRVRIKAAFGTPEFDAEYQAAIAMPRSGRRRRACGWDIGLADRALPRDERMAAFLATRRQRETSSSRCSRSPAAIPSRASLRRASWSAATGGARRRHFRHGISSTPCAGFSVRRMTPRWSRPIQRWA